MCGQYGVDRVLIDLGGEGPVVQDGVRVDSVAAALDSTVTRSTMGAPSRACGQSTKACAGSQTCYAREVMQSS